MTSRPIRIGLQLQPQHADYDTIRRTASAAEDLGADIIFNWDQQIACTLIACDLRKHN
jgi:hypothetical protein